MKNVIIVCVSALAACGGWSKRDSTLEIASIGANTLDAVQTDQVTKLCGCETNPVLGPRGERVPLVPYFGAVLLTHLGVSAALPRGGWRTAWQVASTLLEGAIVARSWSMGYAPWP